MGGNGTYPFPGGEATGIPADELHGSFGTWQTGLIITGSPY